ncbi:hypothetical protein EPG09_22190 [Salmonella enterica]|nr:hypothetical protein [Salmonella enterica]
MFRRSDGNTSISPENIAGQSLSVGFRPLPQTTPFTKECLTITTVFGISGVQVTRILDCIALFQGYPVTIRPEQNPVGQTNVEHIS